jgi:hypothetical protein
MAGRRGHQQRIVLVICFRVLKLHLGVLIDLPKLPPSPPVERERERESRHVKGTEERRRAVAALANKVEGRQAGNRKWTFYTVVFVV